jgi:transcription initiation factor TFIID/TFIIF subunit
MHALAPYLVLRVPRTNLALLFLPLGFTKAPFTCSNEGWGEFEIGIDLYTTEKTKLAPIIHDLNFAETRYEHTHKVVFKNPSQALQERLRETGPLPNDEERPKKKGLASKKSSQKFDYEKIAEALQKLEEEDLLRVIQIINENKNSDTYIRSDVEGEFQRPFVAVCLPLP